MPSFDFSIVKKKTKAGKTSKDSSVYKTVDKNVIGVVWITKNAKYYVKASDGKTYNIKSTSYSCKGKRYIYRQGCDDLNRVCYIRLPDNCRECNSDHWLPFAPGNVVKGNIVLNKKLNSFLFDIKETWVDYGNDDSHKSLEFYREHLKEINNVIRNKVNGT